MPIVYIFWAYIGILIFVSTFDMMDIFLIISVTAEIFIEQECCKHVHILGNVLQEIVVMSKDTSFHVSINNCDMRAFPGCNA